MYICAVRLLHSGNIFGEQTSFIADQLLRRFHEDHHMFFDRLQSFKLHVHSHFQSLYESYGSLCSLGCFAQESFIGFISSNYHEIRYYSDAITHYYNIDFSIQNKNQTTTIVNGPCDFSTTSASNLDSIGEFHAKLCGCDDMNFCCVVFRRCIIHDQMFYSLLYIRRKVAVSYFIRYSLDDDSKPIRFGTIQLFFTCNGDEYAVIKNHRIKRQCSNYFRNSSYYDLLKQPMDQLYHILEKDGNHLHCISIG